MDTISAPTDTISGISELQQIDRLAAMFPEAYASQAKLRTLQRRVKAWRAERVKELILGGLRKSAAISAEA